MPVVGRVAAIWRYPVKSMPGSRSQAVDVSWHGLDGDRRWAFVRPSQERNGFPWLTIRERPDLLSYTPRLEGASVLVRTPDGRDLDVADPALSAALGPGVRVMKQDRGVFDALPLSLLTVQSVAAIGRRCGVELAPERFRPNLLVDAPGCVEDDWVGRVLTIGGLAMRVDARDGRCAVITVDPATLERNRDVLRVVARERENRLGVYGTTVRPGRIAVGDPVEIP